MSLAQNIKYYRQKQNLTQEKLAKALGVSSQAVSKWETSETYPDGALLVSLAQILEVSLDTLFENRRIQLNDLSKKIVQFLYDCPQEERFQMLYKLCLAQQYGIYMSYTHAENIYQSENLWQRERSLPSGFSTKEGFVWYSPNNPPFYAVFPQGEQGYESIAQDTKQMQQLFALLSHSDTLNALIYIHRHTGRFVFEAEILAKDCAIGKERMDQVMEELLQLGVVRFDRLEINGQIRTLYYAVPDHKWIALMSIARSLDEEGPKMLSGNARKAPYLKPIE